MVRTRRGHHASRAGALQTHSVSRNTAVRFTRHSCMHSYRVSKPTSLHTGTRNTQQGVPKPN
eukprot:15030754-Alexandrium_andersonii.AAC.1